MEENIMYSKHKEVRGVGYIHYDNYDAIEVPFTDAIPDKYDGFMGVPISFLDKYCPDQFEIIGITESEGKGASNGIFNAQLPVTQPLTTPRENRSVDSTSVSLSELKIPGQAKYDRPYLNGKRMYFRLFIKRT